MKDTIKQESFFHYPVQTIWNAITDPAKLSGWFGATFPEKFVAGQAAPAVVTYPGYEGLTFEIDIVAIDEPETFAFEWHPYTVDLERDYSNEPKTLVEFRLTRSGDGTVVEITESGFGAIDRDRAEEAYEGNLTGWVSQMKKLADFLRDDLID